MEIGKVTKEKLKAIMQWAYNTGKNGINEKYFEIGADAIIQEWLRV